MRWESAQRHIGVRGKLKTWEIPLTPIHLVRRIQENYGANYEGACDYIRIGKGGGVGNREQGARIRYTKSLGSETFHGTISSHRYSMQ